jgi:hypothetical protein
LAIKYFNEITDMLSLLKEKAVERFDHIQRKKYLMGERKYEL